MNRPQAVFLGAFALCLLAAIIFIPVYSADDTDMQPFEVISSGGAELLLLYLLLFIIPLAAGVIVQARADGTAPGRAMGSVLGTGVLLYFVRYASALTPRDSSDWGPLIFWVFLFIYFGIILVLGLLCVFGMRWRERVLYIISGILGTAVLLMIGALLFFQTGCGDPIARESYWGCYMDGVVEARDPQRCLSLRYGEHPALYAQVECLREYFVRTGEDVCALEPALPSDDPRRQAMTCKGLVQLKDSCAGRAGTSGHTTDMTIDGYPVTYQYSCCDGRLCTGTEYRFNFK